MTISSTFHVLVFPTTIDYSLFTWRMCQSMEGSIHGKCGKMCLITTKFGGGNKKTLDAYEILIWRLQFEKWKCKLPKDWDYGFGFSSSHFRNCAKNWPVTNCTSLHTLGQRMEKEHTESKDSHNVKSWHQQSQKTSSCSHVDCISTVNVMLFWKEQPR